ncbi:MAG: GntR family transcriptional regulator [Rhodospirillales bacterium]|nr:GntR family transcriptional regulator [Rhodospirillales bacterium]
MGISRSTVRSALLHLQDIGIVNRRHGVGTYVNDLGITSASVWGWLDEFLLFEDMIRRSNHVPRMELLEADFREAGAAGAPLRIDPAARVLWIRKLYYSDSVPLLYSESGVPLKLNEEVQESASIFRNCVRTVYQILEEHFHSRVHHQTSEIRAAPADASMAQLLDFEVGQPLLCFEEVGYSLKQVPLFYGRQYFRSDLARFRLVRRPILDISGDGNESEQYAAQA